MDLSIETGGSIAIEIAAKQFGLVDKPLGASAADIVYIPRGGRLDGITSNCITIIDGIDLERCATVEPFKWAKLSTHAHAFGVPQCRVLDFVVFYPPHVRFACAAPTWGSEWFPCVFDAIWDLRNNTPKRWDLNAPFEYDYDSVIPLPDETKAWLPELSSGWSLAELATIIAASRDERAASCPAEFDVTRLSWRTGCWSTLQGNPARWVHPWHHRPLTLGEICSIVGVVPELEQWRQRDNLQGLVFQLAHDIPYLCAWWLLNNCLTSLFGSWPEGSEADSGAHYDMLDCRPQAYNVGRFPDEAAKQFHNFDWRKWGLR